MRLKSFSVENYKVFKKKFDIELTENNIVILTGRNNTGKSTILEAINRFYQSETKTQTIPSDCFSNTEQDIKMSAVFVKNEQEIKIKKVYIDNKKPAFFDVEDKEIKKGHELYNVLEEIFDNKPFYITPSMLPEDIHKLIQDIYKEIIVSTLNELSEIDDDDIEDKELQKLRDEYSKVKEAYPTFLEQVKINTDRKLSEVSENVTTSLRSLFSSEHLGLRVVGGESSGFSAQDIVKSTTSVIEIDDDKKPQMPLENQGTGLQRMSLIFLIQNMIRNGLLGNRTNKLLLIDEPEAFLHPEAIRSLSRSLYEIGAEMPLIISTHSPILIDLSEQHSFIQVFRVNKNRAIELYQTKKSQFEDDDFQNLKILNYVDSYVNEFFFAKEILIVEGDTEYIVFKHLAEKHGYNLHIIRARGKDTINTLMKVLNQFKTPYKVLHDIDNHPKYELSTLKSQRTKCRKIYNEKAKYEGVELYISEANFEQAVGLGDLTNSKKTRFAFELTQDVIKDKKYQTAFRNVEDLFNKMYKGSSSFKEKHQFKKVEDINVYDSFFKNLIEE